MRKALQKFCRFWGSSDRILARTYNAPALACWALSETGGSDCGSDGFETTPRSVGWLRETPPERRDGALGQTALREGNGDDGNRCM
jgi:hypothetical protein